ncbi:hypothetical protein M0R45_008602 [Rubus argutus]|uniref:Uncharacterized protein n=1 Tax=Rubus argutus TaxID=59490 RepID=A0AAW1Y1Q5_RUBAR
MVNLKMTTKYGAMASAIFASIVFAGVYFVRVSTRRNKQEPPKLMIKSMSIAVLHGGQLALKRLVEYHKAKYIVHNGILNFLSGAKYFNVH